VYPVIFLLEGHAFPGYWRSPSAQMDFVTNPEDPAPASAGPSTPAAPATGAATGAEAGSATPPAREPWYFGKGSYTKIVRLIREGSLVPLESVWLTKNKAFWEAVEQGNNNLHDPTEFESMMDLSLARDHDITPLPILAEAR